MASLRSLALSKRTRRIVPLFRQRGRRSWTVCSTGVEQRLRLMEAVVSSNGFVQERYAVQRVA